MTDLTNLSEGASFGDLLTTTNNGRGFVNPNNPAALYNLQDGLGNNSTITIGSQGINFNRSGPNVFQLDGVSLTASATQLNNIAGSPSTFTNPVVLPTWTTGTRPGAPVNGMIGYNSTIPGVEAWYNNAWNTL